MRVWAAIAVAGVFLVAELHQTWLLTWSYLSASAPDQSPSQGRTWPNLAARWHSGGTVTGRLLFLFSANTSGSAPEPRLAAGEDGQVQIFGQDISSAPSGAPVPLDALHAEGYPVQRLQDFPLRGVTYQVQAVVIPYELYSRADGHQVWLPRWDAYVYSSDSDDYGWSPDDTVGRGWGARGGVTTCGTRFSRPVTVNLGVRSADFTLEIVGEVPPPPPPPQETKYAKRVEVQSARLSRFWGRSVAIAAWVLLPHGWHDHSEARYPVVINHGHYSYQAWRGWSEEAPAEMVTPQDPDNPDTCYYCSTTGCLSDCQSDSYDRQYAYYFMRNWTSPGAAFFRSRVLLVRIQHQNPYYDDSYAVNSANLGPYGDAITYELLPEVERRFRGLGQGWARAMVGGSTGGWASLAAQVLYPGEYNGAWANAPDPVDFHALQALDLYSAGNAYFGASGAGRRVPVPAKRSYLGTVLATQPEVCQYEAALGSRSRSGGQYAVWAAVYGPVGRDGYPVPPWDPKTGQIDLNIVEHWQARYDLVHILRNNWSSGLGRRLQGKLHVYVGAMDNFYLDNAVFRLQNFLEDSGTRPPALAEFRYGTSRGRGYNHAWSGDNSSSMRVNDLTLFQRLVPQMVARMLETAPPGSDVTSWRY